MLKTPSKNLNLRPVVEGLSLNPGAEIVRYGRRKADILSLGQGEGDTPTPDFIIKGAEKAMQAGKTFYGPVLGHADFRQEIANYYVHQYQREIPTHRIFVTGSGTTAMHLALTALLDEGDEVVAISPIWKNLLGAVELAQAKITEVPLTETDGTWSLDMNALTDACNARTKALLITTPSNPTGWTMSYEEMKTLMEFARTQGIWIVSDEVYGRITYDKPHAPSFLEVSQPDDLLFTVNSFSKSWAMTGWRLGWLVGPASAEEPIRDIALYDNMGPPSFTQYAAIEALRHGEPFIQEQLSRWQENIDIFMEWVDGQDKIRACRPDSTFYSFFRVEGESDCLNFARRLIDDYSLSLAPGCAFGNVGKGYMRLCFAVSKSKLTDALDRLEKAIK